jgi:hypothetical protein
VRGENKTKKGMFYRAVHKTKCKIRAVHTVIIIKKALNE